MSTSFAEMVHRARQGTPENLAVTEMVVEIARDWRAGAYPLGIVRATCDGYDRFIAINHCASGSEERALVQAMLDALVDDLDATEPAIQTKHGPMTPLDLAGTGGRITRDSSGRRVVQFPVAYEHGRPIFREIPEHKLAEGA